MTTPTVGILMRLHRRDQYLPRIFAQINELASASGAAITLVLLPDRPTPAVTTAIEGCRATLGPPIQIDVLPAPRPVLSHAGTAWQAPLEAGRQLLGHCRHGMVWDDDLLLTPALLDDLAGEIRAPVVDRVDASWLQLWDKPDQYNAAFYDHVAPMLWRNLPGDAFTPDHEKLVHAPKAAARSHSARKARGYVLHYGFLTPEDRAANLRARKPAGQLDPHWDLMAVKPPILRPLPC